ncbi:MAG: RHS repeat-associated core domain-containing protein [Clostridia bacterium]|nr:RHS repeat-associated core domain-containing protein [Clostridia bacterium]
MIYNGTAYGYLYNLQGDVVALVDGTGTKVVEYTYDAWGKLTSKMGTMAGTLGTVQPFRYRGYVFDEETGLYYLRSRYYRPEWCRFVSADALIKGNLYCYCKNSPINCDDQDGHLWMIALLSAVLYNCKHRKGLIRSVSA